MSNDKPKNEFRSVGQAIREMLNSYRITSKFDEATLVSSWERIVGKPIAKRTKKIFIKDKVLFVEFASAAMKQDFSLHKSHILDLFSKEFGNGIIKEIVVL